jgi:hypothetical protein
MQQLLRKWRMEERQAGIEFVGQQTGVAATTSGRRRYLDKVKLPTSWAKGCKTWAWKELDYLTVCVTGTPQASFRHVRIDPQSRRSGNQYREHYPILQGWLCVPQQSVLL